VQQHRANFGLRERYVPLICWLALAHTVDSGTRVHKYNLHPLLAKSHSAGVTSSGLSPVVCKLQQVEGSRRLELDLYVVYRAGPDGSAGNSLFNRLLPALPSGPALYILDLLLSCTSVLTNNSESHENKKPSCR